LLHSIAHNNIDFTDDCGFTRYAPLGIIMQLKVQMSPYEPHILL
jgi:hypothetical protein